MIALIFNLEMEGELSIKPRYSGDTMFVVSCDHPRCTTPPFGPLFGKNKTKKMAERAGWRNGDGVKWQCPQHACRIKHK
jgi:hypothetical protein